MLNANTRWLIVVALVILLGFSLQKSKKGTKDTSKISITVISFKRDITPIFKKNCLPCHTEENANPSELYLDSYENVIRGGKHGVAVVPGKPDSSFIIRKISAHPPFGDPMPRKRKTPFPQDTLNILRQWILQGAKNN